MRDHVPAPQLFTWLFCIIALNCAHYVYAQVASRPHQDLSPSRQSSAALTSFAAISGLVWGAAAVLFFPTDAVLHEVFLTFVIGGLVAGSAVSYASWPPAFYAFAVPSILPLAVQFIWQGNENSVVMGIMLIVYGAALSSLARKFSSSLINSAELQFEKDSLLDDLSQAKERYDLCLEGSHDGIWDWDIDQREIYASPAFAEIMGVSLTGAPFPETEFVRHIHGDDRVEFQHALDAHRKGETEVLYCEFRTSGDGDNTRWVLYQTAMSKTHRSL